MIKMCLFINHLLILVIFSVLLQSKLTSLSLRALGKSFCHVLFSYVLYT